LNGKEIARLLDNQTANTGVNYVEWNGKNAKGITASSGVYFYKIEARSMETGKTEFLQVKSMMLMK
jgi:flagellar hook assembly protein FlgD